MDNHKTCSKCEVSQQTGNFTNDKSTKDGKCLQCKSCQKNYREINQLKLIEKNQLWRKANSQRVKNYNKLYRQENHDKVVAATRAWYLANREKQSASSKAWYEANKETATARWRSWAKNNPDILRANERRRRARKQKAKTYLITAKDAERILSKPCLYCGIPSEHLDHVIPLSRGGDHSIGNLVGACGPCNLSKGSRTVTEWRVWKLRLAP